MFLFQNETEMLFRLVFAVVYAITVPIERGDWRRKTREWGREGPLL